MLDVNIVVRQNFGHGRTWQCIGPGRNGINIVHDYALYLYNTRTVDHYDFIVSVLENSSRSVPHSPASDDNSSFLQ